jgi:hypothetical protein
MGDTDSLETRMFGQRELGSEGEEVIEHGAHEGERAHHDDAEDCVHALDFTWQ